MDVGVNWAGNHRYAARTLHRPASVEQVRELVAVAASVRVLGSRHSFNDIADAEQLISLDALPDDVVVDPGAGTVSFAAGLRYGALAVHLARAGLALHNLASLPHISVAGAVATATHGSGVGNGNLATAVAGLELVTSAGELLRVSRGDPDFDGLVVGLGALGAVTRITLDVQPAYEVLQRVFEGLRWAALAENFEAIMASGYSVSVFTRWQETVDQVWVKSRLDQLERRGSDLFGAVPASIERHPILGIDPAPATPQLGRPGPWYERLPHFRMGFTPSAGEELQSEYLLPRRHAVAAIEAVRALADRIRPLLLVTEIRTVAADGLWMSTSYGEDSVALHFTWRQEPGAVAELLTVLERVLAPFGARPHWGKVFLAGAASISPLYERHADFVALAARLDARGAFRNAWLEERVLGSSG
jgi:alditol oxidase